MLITTQRSVQRLETIYTTQIYIDTEVSNSTAGHIRCAHLPPATTMNVVRFFTRRLRSQILEIVLDHIPRCMASAPISNWGSGPFILF